MNCLVGGSQIFLNISGLRKDLYFWTAMGSVSLFLSHSPPPPPTDLTRLYPLWNQSTLLIGDTKIYTEEYNVIYLLTFIWDL